MDDRQILSNDLNKKFVLWRNINRCVDRILLFILLSLIAFVGSALLDNWKFLERGMGTLPYHNFDELLAINPDTVAWLTIPGTHIDHPVVQGKDNFEYLDKGFDGRFYAGGCLFLDCSNKRDFSEDYNIIHGHHMAGGAMFADLDKFKDAGFFAEHRAGTLLTPSKDYDLEILAVGEYDAYDPKVYAAGYELNKGYIGKTCLYMRKDKLTAAGKVLALSTCSGDMSDNRTVLLCEMTGERKHE